MDRVRFGRALGYGARHAAKSLAKAVEAATAPSPTSHSTPSEPPAQPHRAASIVSNLAEAHQTVQQAKRQIKTEAKAYAQASVKPSAKTHARALGKSAWAPLAKFSSVIWLQVTGSFFLLIALFFGQSLWTNRHELLHPANPTNAHQLTLHAVIFVAFLYFALSNFVRARKREKR